MLDPALLSESAQILLHPQVMMCTGALMFLFLAGIVVFLILYLRSKKKVFLVLGVVAILVILGCAGFELLVYRDYDYKMYHKNMDYSLTLSSQNGENELVYFPVSSCPQLQDEIRLTSGDGRMSFIDTANGTALAVNFTGTVKIYGKLDTADHDVSYGDLTMRDGKGGWDDPYFLVYYLPSATDHNCSASMSAHTGVYDRYGFNGVLRPGWNTYEFDFSSAD
jgi:hypothetical protein